VTLKDGCVLRMGGQVIKCERRSQQDVKRTEELNRDIQKATDYVWSLLPAPIGNGQVLAEWRRFVPSTQLGGDAFSTLARCEHVRLLPRRCLRPRCRRGHALGDRPERAPPASPAHVDFKNPAEVLSSLNARSRWTATTACRSHVVRVLTRAPARSPTLGGAPPGVSRADRQARGPTLGMPALMIGILPDQAYEVQETAVPPGSRLFLFSDGAYEIVTKDQQRWSLGIPAAPARAGGSGSTRNERSVSTRQGSSRLRTVGGRLLAHRGDIPLARKGRRP
jgi:sigma-B regulation protein RsbU (phosphoserine phosphatase)